MLISIIFIDYNADDNEALGLEDVTLNMIFSKSLKCLLFFLNSFKIKCCPWFLLLVLGCTVFNLVRFVIIYRQGVYVLCKTRVTKP